MSNIKKINGYNIKDELARSKADIIVESFDAILAELEDLRYEITVIEQSLLNIDEIINNKIEEYLQNKESLS